MIAPRRLQLRRGNTSAISTYTGAAGEITVNTTNWTLYVHDGSTAGGHAIASGATTYSNVNVVAYLNTTGYNLYSNVNVIAYLSSISNATTGDVTAANVGLKGYVDLANTIQSAQLASANIGIIGYVDLANTIQSAQITAANVGMKGYVDSVSNQSIYGNANVASYLAQGNITIGTGSGNAWTFGQDQVLTLPPSDFDAFPFEVITNIKFTGNGAPTATNKRITETLNDLEIFVDTPSGSTSWTFGYDGNLKLPFDSGIIFGYAGTSYTHTRISAENESFKRDIVVRTGNLNASSNHAWTFSGDGALSIPGDINFSSAQVISTPSASSIKVSAGTGDNTGAIFDNTGEAELYANTNVFIYANTVAGQKTWQFGADGITHIPGTLDFSSAQTISTPSSTSIKITAGQGDASGATFDNTGEVELYANTNVYIYSNSTTSQKTWNFDNVGDLTLPGNIRSTRAAGITVGSNYSAYIVVDFGDNNHTWTFDGSTAELVFPDSTSQATAWTGVVDYGNVTNTPAAPNLSTYAYSANVTAANIGMIGYVDNALSTANIGIIGYIGLGNTIQSAQITSANLGMKGYVDSLTYSNIQVASYLTVNPQPGTYSNVQVATYLSAYDGALTFTASPAIISGVGSISTIDITATGNISGNTNGYTVGYLDIPQVAAGNVTLALGDRGKHYYATATAPTTLTIPSNANVAFQTGSAITIINKGTGTITVAKQVEASLYMAGNSTSATRTISSYGMATLIKTATNEWFINGTGVA